MESPPDPRSSTYSVNVMKERSRRTKGKAGALILIKQTHLLGLNADTLSSCHGLADVRLNGGLRLQETISTATVRDESEGALATIRLTFDRIVSRNMSNKKAVSFGPLFASG
jgi:hypothetical protein